MLRSLKLLLLSAALSALVAPIAGQEKSRDETAARELLQKVNDVYWESATAYRKFADETLSPEILMREKLRPFYSTMEGFAWQNFSDPLLRRQFEVILRGRIYPELNFKFKRATQILKGMSRQKWACQPEKPNVCNLAFVHQIKSIFTNSDNLDEIKYYWAEWRNKMPSDVKNSLIYYVNYYKNLSTPLLPASAIWYDQYESADLINDLEDLMNTIKPFYRELHAHLRHVLRAKYGDDVVPKTGLIPHHLLEQVIYQAWKKDSVLKNPFAERRLPNLQAELDENQLKPIDLVKISAEYFSSLGFQNISEQFMKEHFFEMEAGSGGPDCKSRIFDYGEIEMQYCPKVYYKKLLQTHGDMARVQYALAKNNYRVGLNQEACPGFGNAIGEAIILSVSNPKHLQKRLSLLENYEYDDLLNLNRLYRLAVHTLLTVPTYFVHEKLWVDMIDGKVQPENYTCHYWNLMQQYMGIDAPVQTNPGVFDMPYKFYEGIVDQFRSTKKFFGELLGYEIYRAICLEIGEFERGNAYKTLDNCDFAGSQHAGMILREMMEAGSKMPWREVIKPLNKRRLPKITGTAFLEYFESLHEYLRSSNAELNLKIGWMPVDKCRSAGNASIASLPSEDFF